MRQALISLVMVFWAGAAVAEDPALILGTDTYAEIGQLPNGTEPVAAADSLRELGFTVFHRTNVGINATNEALFEFTRRVPDADRVVVVLSGRFVTDGSRTWYLTRYSPRPVALSVNAQSLSVDTVMQIMASVPGQAVLILAFEPNEATYYSRWLYEGVGALDVPQGVTVLTGRPRDVSLFMSNEMGRPGENLMALVAQNPAITALGYQPDALTLWPASASTGAQGFGVAEQIAWEQALALDSYDGYQDYLQAYPGGPRAAEAYARIEAILSEPFRDARLAEEALGMSGDVRRAVQEDLTVLGYNTQGVDGIFGTATRQAIINWQQRNGFAQTSYLTAEQIRLIDQQATAREIELALAAEAQRQQEIADDRTFWSETGANGTEAGMRAYLETYPSGLFAEVARARIAAFEQARAEQAAADEQAWGNATGANTIAAYNAYLAAFPDGRFAYDARQRISALEEIAAAQGTVSTGAYVAPDGQVWTSSQLAAMEGALGLTTLTRRVIEQRLAELGIDPGPVDGTFDGASRAAIARFQQNNGLAAHGYIDEATGLRLLQGL